MAAARLGATTAFAGVVGLDDEGDRIIAGLQAEGVDTTAVVRNPHQASGVSVIVVSTRSQSRAIVTRPGPPVSLPATGPFRDALESASWVHVDHWGWQSVAGIPGLKLSVDAGNPIDGFTPADTDLYVPTIERLTAEYGQGPSEPELLQRAINDGARTVVATDGANGSWVHDGTGEAVHIPAHRANIVSTLGAGDVFHGALLAAVAANYNLEDAATFAGRIAAASCEGLDGRSAIPHDQILHRSNLPTPTSN